MSFKPSILQIFSCKHFTELESKCHDEGSLSGFDRFSYLFHKAICLCCRRYARQLQLVEKAVGNLIDFDSKDLETAKATQLQGLTTDSRERIAKAIKEGSC